MSRGRMGLCIALMAGLLVGGCAHKTPEQKAQAKAQKAAVAQAKADKKAADKQAKAQAKAEKQRLAQEQKRAEEQAKAAKKQAEAQAKADKQRVAEEQKKAEAQAKIDQQNAAAQARIDHENAEAAAAAQRRQTQMAMADAKANEVATKKAAKKSKSAKKEKPIEYPDDKVDVIGHPYQTPENYTWALDRSVEAMAAAGAVTDATLYDQHFDGGELSALGRSKVALMLEAAPKHEPLTIYLPATGSDERSQARVEAVNKFWKDSQYAAIEVRTKQGLNPNNTSPASIGIAGLKKMEKEQNGSSSGSSNSSSSGSSSSGSSSSGSSSR